MAIRAEDELTEVIAAGTPDRSAPSRLWGPPVCTDHLLIVRAGARV
jgi:hypothetical protein